MGGEYISNRLQTFLQSKGIEHYKSCPYTPEQNGLTERKHRHIIETTVTLLQYAKLPSQYWFFACQAVVYLINRMPTPVLKNQSPFEALFGTSHVITYLRMFGCSCFPLLKPYNTSKLQPKTTQCVFLGYASKYKGFICLDVLKCRIYISRHVVFDETRFPYQHLLSMCKHKSTISKSSSQLSFNSNPIISTSLSSPQITPPLLLHSEPSFIEPLSPLSSQSSTTNHIPTPLPSLLDQSIIATTTTNSSSSLPVDLEFSPKNL